MASRPIWKGSLKLQLVTVPVQVFPATEAAAGLEFHQLHTVCSSRIKQKKTCTACARDVASGEIARGFEVDAARYVVLSDEDFANARPPSTRVIEIAQIVAAGELEPHYIDRSYYLAPDGPRAAAPLAVLRVAFHGRAAIGKLAIYGREYLVAVRPKGEVLMLHTLHHGAGLRAPATVSELLGGDVPVPAADLRLARQLVAGLVRPPQRLDLAAFPDAYQAELRRLIDAKIAGQEIVVAPIAAPAVIDLREALIKSLAAMAAAVPAAPTAKRSRA